MIGESRTDRLRRRWLRLRRIAANQVDAFRAGGIAGNVRALRFWLSHRLPEGEFTNGVRVLLSPRSAAAWHRRRGRPIAVVALRGPVPGIADWLDSLPRRVRVELVDEGRPPVGDWSALSEILRSAYPGRDVLLVTPDGGLPDAGSLIRMQHAAATYPTDRGRIAMVTPSLVPSSGNAVNGFEWDREASAWTVTPSDPAHRRESVPRYVLAAPDHALYLRAEAVEALAAAPSSLDTLGRGLVRAAWQQGLRTLAFPAVEIPSSDVPVPPADEADRRWRGGRSGSVRASVGGLRIIYVLKATSMSGGIRTVFEQSRYLREAGHEVSIWSLQGAPDWIETDTPVVTFRDFPALLAALEVEDAVKIATWWETAQIVWLASVNRGIPVNYVQEFETWFYPDNPVSRAAVAASYRREMAHVTIADYQRGELDALAVPAVTISSAYEPAGFHLLEGVLRRDDTVLAVGRTFFQKNLRMTIEAWRSLGDDRPRLQLFGFEPELVDDPRIAYAVRPSDREVNVLYNEATCFVQTSLHEGFGLPILEAMAAGCPVITTDSHGNRDFCVPGENCLMVPQNDPDALAAAIRRLLGDPGLQDRLRVAGLLTASRHTWARVSAELARYFASLD